MLPSSMKWQIHLHIIGSVLENLGLQLPDFYEMSFYMSLLR